MRSEHKQVGCLAVRSVLFMYLFHCIYIPSTTSNETGQKRDITSVERRRLWVDMDFQGYSAIDLLHKSQNAPVTYAAMLHFVREIRTHTCTFVLQTVSFWDICLMHCWICDIGPLFGTHMLRYIIPEEMVTVELTSVEVNKGTAHITLWWRHMASEILINIDSGNGFLPDGTKTLLEPMLTYHQRGPVTITSGHQH